MPFALADLADDPAEAAADPVAAEGEAAADPAAAESEAAADPAAAEGEAEADLAAAEAKGNASEPATTEEAALKERIGNATECSAPCNETDTRRAAGIDGTAIAAAIRAAAGSAAVNSTLLKKAVGNATKTEYKAPPSAPAPAIHLTKEPFAAMQAEVRKLATQVSDQGKDVQYVWLPLVDTPKVGDVNLSYPLTPMPTPAGTELGPYGKLNAPSLGYAVGEELRQNKVAAAKTEEQVSRESVWAKLAQDTFQFFGLSNAELPSWKEYFTAPKADANATTANQTAANGTQAQGVTSFFQDAPEPALLLQVNSDGTVINLRKAAKAGMASLAEGKASPLKARPRAGSDDSEGGSGGMPLAGVYDPRPQVDMGIVGWASVPQMDHQFNLRTLGFTLFLLGMFYCIVGLGLLLTFKTAILHPEVKFFSGLKPQHDVCRAESTASILQAFNQKPKVRMHVKGKGLDFQLDLGSWISEGAVEATAPIEEFVRSKCPFRSLTIVQQVSCPAAKDLEKRVVAKLQQSGYVHPLQVSIPLEQHVRVYRNDQLANFLHNRTTRLLLAISGVGLMFWPISWCRQRVHTVKAHWRLNIDVDRFWAHVGPRIHRGGFRP